MRTVIVRSIACATVVSAALCSAAPSQAQQPLTQLRFDIIGLRLQVNPDVLTVPKNIPTEIDTLLALPSGAGPEAINARATLQAESTVEAELRGPGLPPSRIVVRPGQPIPLHAFVLAGDYFLENIRLIKDGQVVLAATPDRVPIHVIDQVFITSVTTRPLSLDEIRAKGIVIDERNFQVLNFELALNLGSGAVKIKLPVALPNTNQNMLGKDITVLEMELARINAQLAETVEIPPDLQRPGINFSIAAVPFFPVEDVPDELKRFGPPPITGLVLIPGNVAFLNQFFSAQVIVANVAPDGTPLILRDVQARMTLPPGLDRTPGTYDTPGDDPLRLARIEGVGVQPLIEILHVGADGQRVSQIRPQETGGGEFLVEGLHEGIHSMDIGIDAVLDGLPSGPVRLHGQSGAVVLVRNPRFSIALSHPRTVRAGETYDLFATVTNTSQTMANLVSVSLYPRGITGAELLSEPSATFPTIAPGDSATASFRLVARRTGTVDYSFLETDSNLAGAFELRTGIGERGITLSGATIVLPPTVGFLPSPLVAAAQRVLGQAFSIATAPAGGLPPGVAFITGQTVTARGIELAEAGQRLEFGEPLGQVVAELLFDWGGSRYQDDGFDQLLRTTGAGAAFLAEAGRMLGPDLTASGGVLDYQRAHAESSAYRSPFISVLAGSSGLPAPVTLSIGDPAGLTAGMAGAASTLPYGYAFSLFNQNESSSSLLAANLGSTLYVVEAHGTSHGPFDLGVVIPSGVGAVTQLRFAGVPMHPGGLARLVVDLSSASYLLLVDADGDGAFEQTLPPQVIPITEQPARVVGARQVTTLTGTSTDPARFGMVIGVLFSKPMDQASAGLAGNYAVENNGVTAARLQPSGRLVYVVLRKGIGVHIPRRVSVQGVLDERGQIITPDDRVITAVLSAGGQVLGRVRTADGTALSDAPVTLKVLICDDEGCRYVPISQVLTRDDGTYDFDFVTRETPIIMEALDRGTNEVAARGASLRGDGERLLLDLVFIGKGSVRGRVLAADGATPVPSARVVLNPAPNLTISDSQQTAQEVDANEAGEFVFTTVPVGNFVLTGYGQTGYSGIANGVINTAGDRAAVDVVLAVDPARLGRLTGRVFDSDGTTPLANATVYVGNSGPGGYAPVASVTTDASGSFTVERLQETDAYHPYEVIAIDPATSRHGSASVQVVAGQTAFAIIILEATGAVEGVVYNAQGQLVSGAVVAGGFTLGTTDANGFFHIEGVPAGLHSIEAGDPVTKRRGSVAVTVLPGQTVRAEVTLEARATIVGYVLDANGHPVPRATVRIVTPSGYFFVFANNRGFYRFPDMTLGEYLIQAPGPPQEFLIGFMIAKKIDPILAFTAGDAPPQYQNSDAAVSADAILDAYRQAVNTYIGETDRLLSGLPPLPEGGFGWTKVRLFQDSVTVSADVHYLSQGTASGRTLSAAGVPAGSLTRLMALSVNRFGGPAFDEVTRKNSDAQTGVFEYDGIPRFDLATFQTTGIRAGDFTIEAANPFSPVVVRYSSQLNTSNLNEQDIELRFPALSETNGTIGGQVFLPDGSTPAGADVQVVVSFGNLTVTTDSTGHFVSTFPIPASTYAVTAFDPSTGFYGVTNAAVPAAGHVDVAIRLVGWGRVVVTARRADGSLVVGGRVTLMAGGFPNPSFQGFTDAQGQVRFANVPEGFAGISLEEAATGLTGRAAVAVVRDAEAEGVVVLAPSGRVRGTFLRLDGHTVIPTALVELVRGDLRIPGSTDANGRFELLAIPVGRFSVTAFDPVTGRLGRASGEVVSEGAVASVTLIETARGRVEGVVLQADGATRVGAATVTLTTLDISTAVPLQASAFSDGSFSFDGVSAGHFGLSAQDPVTRFSGNADGEVTAEGEVVRREILLEPFGSVRVTVRDHTDAIVPNARVTIKRGLVNREAPVDDTGTATFDAVRLGQYEVLATSLAAGREHDGGVASVKLTGAGEVAEATVRLGGVGSLVVTVVGPDGAPVPGARVSVTANAALPGQAARPFGGSFLAFTAGDGKVRVEGVPVGAFFVLAEADLVAGLSTGVVAAPDAEVPVTVQLSPSASVRGRVFLPGGTILAARAYVTLNFQAQNSLQSGTIQVTTSLDGRFSFDGIPLGPVSIAVLEPITRGVRTRSGSLTSSRQILDFGDLVLDNEAPFVESVTPARGSMGVSRTTAIVLRFNEPMRRSSFVTSGQNKNIELLQGQSSVPATIAFSADDRTVTITPAALPLASTALYTAIVRGVPDGPEDVEGLKPIEAFVTSFLIEDYIPPSVLSASPGFGARAVTLDAPVRLTFSEPVGQAFAASLRSSGGQVIPGTAALTLGGTVITFVPDVFLSPNESYTFALTGVRDIAGNPLAPGPLALTFATLRTIPPSIAALEIVGTPSRIGGSSVTVIPRIADEDVARVEYLAGDGSSVAGAGPFTTIVALPHGRTSIDVTAVAVDSSGNRSPAVRLTIPIVTNQPPTVAVTRPDGGATLASGRSVRLRVDAADDLFLRSVTVSAVGAFALNRTFDVPADESGFAREFDIEVPDVAGNVRIQAVALDSVGNVSIASTLTYPVEQPPTDAPVIGGFNSTRAPAFGLVDGSELTSFRSDLAAMLPAARLTSAATLTDAFLAPLDVAMLASPAGNGSSVPALSRPEQRALRTFVLNGGGAVLLVDNDTFVGGAAGVNNSLLAAFGMHVTGTDAAGSSPATIADPPASPVTSGPFGTVSTLNLAVPGWLDVLGPATALGTLDVNGMPFLAVIPEGALGPGSGAVVVVTDTDIASQWWNPAYRTLVLNAISHVRTRPLEDFEDRSLDGWTLTGAGWTVGGTTNTTPNVTPADGRAFARSGAPDVPSGSLAESNVGMATSPPYQVTHDELRWYSAGWSGPSNDGRSFFQILDAQLNVKAQIAAPQSDSWVPISTNLVADGLSLGDTFYFRAVDGDDATSRAWLAFDKLMLRGSVPHRVTPVITWPAPADIVYGVTLSATQLNATANVTGSFVYTPASGTLLMAGGARPLTVEFEPDDLDHYDTATATVLINVAKASQAVLVAGAPASAAFGSGFGATVSGGSGSGAVTFIVSGVCGNTGGGSLITMTSGTGMCTITAAKAADANFFAVTSGPVSVAAAKAPQAPFAVTDAPQSAPDGTAFTVGAVGGSGTGAVAVSASGACANTDGAALIRMTSATGVCTIAATKAADGNFQATTSIPVLVAAGGDAPPVLDIVQTTASVGFCAGGDPLCPASGAPIQGSITARLQAKGVSVKTPPGGVALTVNSSDSQCVVVSNAALAGGAFGTSIPVSYGGSAALPCSATVTVETLNFGSDAVLVTVHRYAQAPLTNGLAAVSYFNPAPVPNPGGRVATGVAALSYVNPAPVPNPGGRVATGVAALSYYNPAPVPNPGGRVATGVAAVSYVNPESAAPQLAAQSISSGRRRSEDAAAVTSSLSLANGPTATALTPIRLSRAAVTRVVLTIEGFNLTNATGVRFVGIENDVSLGALAVSDDGRQLTVEVFVLSSAPLGMANVVVTGPGWSTPEVPAMRVEIVP